MVVWVIEPSVFGPEYDGLRAAIDAAGHREVIWDDEWWTSPSRPPALSDEVVVFHGSLGNAVRISEELDWKPGAYCNSEAFLCSRWYPGAGQCLVHQRWLRTTVSKLCAETEEVRRFFDGSEEVFVRPDSALKEFSGRVVRLEGLTPGQLDHGFYYEDVHLPVIVAPTILLGSEYRFLVVRGTVVTGSGYEPDGRQSASRAAPIKEAQGICDSIEQPSSVFMLDLAQYNGTLRVLELTPFSGADLYECDYRLVVDAVSAEASGT